MGPAGTRFETARRAAFEVALCAVAAAWFWPFATANLMLAQDEGVEATAALQILGGRTLYAGIMQSVKLPVYLLALLFKAFGARLVVARLFELCVCVLLALAVHRFVARRTNAWFGLGAAAASAAWSLPFWNIVGWDWEGILLVVVSSAVFARHLEAGAKWRLAMAGALCGVTFFFQPDSALLAAAGFAAILVLKRLVERAGGAGTSGAIAREVGALAAGFAGVVGSVAAVAAAAGFLGEMTRQMVAGPLGNFGFIGSRYIPFPIPPYARPAESWWYGADFVVFGVYLLPFAVLPVSAALTLRSLVSRDPRRWDDALVVVAGTVIFMQVFPRSDLQHYVFALTGLSILLAWSLHRLGERFLPRPEGRAWRAAPLAALLLPLVVFAADGVAKAVPQIRGPLVRSSFPALAGIRIPADREDEFRGIAKFLHSKGLRRGDEVLVLPADPILYFVIGIANPARHNCIDPGFHDENDEREVVGVIENKRLPWVIFKGWGTDKGFERYAPIVHAYLAGGYRPAGAFGAYTVLARGGVP
ncbi:MAG: hypothetical protein HY897_11410 [Deltaproteobacteria bacterium]|nr:hypothetical protein [Deltaproteobacteria bacterium]